MENLSFPYSCSYSTIEITCARLSPFTVLCELRKPSHFLGPHFLHQPSISSPWFCDPTMAPLWFLSSWVLEFKLSQGRAHLLYLRDPPLCLCSPGQMSLYSVKIRVFVPRKKDGRWNHKNGTLSSAGSSMTFSPWTSLCLYVFWYQLVLVTYQNTGPFWTWTLMDKPNRKRYAE